MHCCGVVPQTGIGLMIIGWACTYTGCPGGYGCCSDGGWVG